jgi:hypothetical protein
MVEGAVARSLSGREGDQAQAEVRPDGRIDESRSAEAFGSVHSEEGTPIAQLRFADVDARCHTQST